MKKSRKESNSPNSIEFFDLDHTLLKGNSSYEFGLYLVREKVIPRSSLLFILWCQFLYIFGLISITQLHNLAFSRLFFGRSRDLITECLDPFLDKYLTGLKYSPACERLQIASKRGAMTLILSSSPDFLVGPIAHRLRVDAWHATKYSVDNKGRFFAISHLVLGDDKAKIINSYLQKYKLQKHNVTAYSDSYADLAFLASAGNPVAVRPDRKLRALCKLNSWPII